MKLRVSSISKWYNCPLSAVLEKNVPERLQSPEAKEGENSHILLQDAFLKENPEKLNPNEKVAYDFLIALKKESCYYTSEMFVEYLSTTGHIDYIFNSTSYLTIVDYKYGEGVPVYAVNNLQLLGYLYLYLRHIAALDIAKINLSDEKLKVRLIIVQPRTNVGISVWELTLQEFYGIWNVKILQAISTCQRAEIYPFDYPQKEGDYCRFCSAFGICNQYLSKLKEFNIEYKALEDKQICKILDKSDFIKKFLKEVEDEARRRLKTGESKSEDLGYELVLKEGRAERIWDLNSDVRGVATGLGIDLEKKEIKSPYQIEKEIGKKEFNIFLSSYVIKKTGELKEQLEKIETKESEE